MRGCERGLRLSSQSCGEVRREERNGVFGLGKRFEEVDLK